MYMNIKLKKQIIRNKEWYKDCMHDNIISGFRKKYLPDKKSYLVSLKRNI